jgi:hypothetical protein
VAQTTKANQDGIYTFPFLQPGPYEISCEMTGFKKFVVAGIILETGGVRTVDITLELGSVSETVQVTSSAPLLEGTTSTVGQLVEHASVANMPIQNRRVASLMRLMGNVVYYNESQSSEAIPNFTMGGGRNQNQLWNLDGAVVQNMTLGAPLLTFNPPTETIEEFKAETNNYAAEFGRAGSGLVLMTSRSGSNNWHGAAYEFLRNERLDTRTFFAPRKAPLRYNIFGTSLSGPIRHDKTFFFFNYEGARRRDGQTISNTIVPHPAEITGDFSVRRDLTLLDPVTRQPFPGNIIPANRIDPVGAALAKLWPAPNVASDDPTRASSANYIANASDQITQNFVTARFDHNFNEQNRLYARFNYVVSLALTAPVYPITSADFRAMTQDNDQTIIMGSWIRNIRPTLINELRANYGLRSNVTRNFGANSGQNGKLGITGVDQNFLARIDVAGLTGLAVQSQQRLQLPILTEQASDSITWIRGRHQLKFGGEYRLSANEDINSPTAGGQFIFGNRATGSGLAELLLGWVSTGQANVADLIRSRSDYWGAYVQDDLKATSRLTFNLGVRWDMDTPRWETHNRQSGFNPYTLNPVGRVPGVITFAGLNGQSKYAHDFDKNNFGPRVGFAYRLGDRTVFRGGYGVAYNGIYFGAVPFILTNGFGVNAQFTSPDGGFTQAFFLKDGLPVTPKENLGPGFGAVPIGQGPRTAVDYMDPHQVAGYMQQWNFSAQRSLTGNVVGELSYQANVGHKLGGPGINVNISPLVDGHGPARQAQTQRLFPQFSNITWQSPDWGNSTYHAMNLRFEKRYSGGLNLLGNFTWAKFIDDVAAGGELGGAPSGYQHWQLHRLDKSNSGGDVRRRLMVSSVYDLPFRKGGKWEIHNPVVNAVLGGWGLSVIAEVRDGLPYGATMLTDGSNTFGSSQRPNLLRDPALYQSSRGNMIARYFDSTAFAAPPAGYYGNAARTVGFGPGVINLDGSVNKQWALHEAWKLRFRTDFYNFPNRPLFANPNNVLGQADFGRVTSVLSGSTGRLIQMSMRLEF